MREKEEVDKKEEMRVRDTGKNRREMERPAQRDRKNDSECTTESVHVWVTPYVTILGLACQFFCRFSILIKYLLGLPMFLL